MHIMPGCSGLMNLGGLKLSTSGLKSGRSRSASRTSVPTSFAQNVAVPVVSLIMLPSDVGGI